MNLTAIEDPVEVSYKHFVDSVCLLRVASDIQEKSMIDIGTGAGFPGVPLKIMEPELDLTLFDSLNKRILFLQEVSVCCAVSVNPSLIKAFSKISFMP